MKYLTGRRINIRTIRNISENGGLTLKNGKALTYKSGWQVADYGVECHTPEECMRAIRDMGGNCGIWLSNGIYYVDHSYRVTTRAQAMAVGVEHNQLTVLKWATMAVVDVARQWIGTYGSLPKKFILPIDKNPIMCYNIGTTQ